MIAMPAARPQVPHFSSGPCAKRPGWTLQALKDAFLARSHRAKGGKAQAQARHRGNARGARSARRLSHRHRAGLRYRRGRNGDVVDAGRAARHHDRVGILWRRLGDGRRQAAQAQGRDADQGALRQAAGPVQGRSQVRHRIHLERHHLGRARAECRLDQRDPRRHHDLRRHLGGVRAAARLGQARCGDLLVAEGARRRGRARHADPFAARRRAA